MNIRSGKLIKKDIAIALGYTFGEGKKLRIDYEGLRKYFFTDDFLLEIGLTPDEYHRKKPFDFHIAQKIIAKLESAKKIT